MKNEINDNLIAELEKEFSLEVIKEIQKNGRENLSLDELEYIINFNEDMYFNMYIYIQDSIINKYDNENVCFYFEYNGFNVLVLEYEGGRDCHILSEEDDLEDAALSIISYSEELFLSLNKDN